VRGVYCWLEPAGSAEDSAHRQPLFPESAGNPRGMPLAAVTGMIRLEQVRSEMLDRFERVDRRFAQNEQRLARIDQRTAELAERLETLLRALQPVLEEREEA
jgi:hypothetical protein